MIETIKNLTSPEYLVSRLEKCCDSVTREKNGNVIGYVRGTDSTSPLMIATHYDLPHFICTGVENEKVSLVYVGNFKPESTKDLNIISENGACAVIDESEDKFTATVGQGTESINIGDRFYVKDFPSPDTFGISALAPDLSLLLTVEKLSASRPCRDVYFAFTAEGQYGFKLYSAAAKKCRATEALCVGVIDAEASPGVSVRLCDRSFSSDKALSDRLISCGGAPVSIREGKCAASTVQLWGIPSAQLDLPVHDLGKLTESVKEDVISMTSDILAVFCNK
ncbi:MAG: hypothetical protein IKV40_02185 [Clostridia bacterium]|nr:hypothetical protein [Clostridia bacterium]